MSNLGITVSGFPELQAKIRELANDKDKKKEILLILRQVARPTLRAAKSAAPISKKAHMARGFLTQSGNLKKSLGFIKSKSENPTVLLGPLVSRARGFNGFGNGWYGHMVHDGHAIYRNDSNRAPKKGRKKSVLARVTRKRKGNAVGRVEGDPFMDIAYEQTKKSTTADAQKQLTNFVQRRINKLSK